MAETPSQQTPTPTQTQSVMDPDPMEYWCYHCDKQVSIETLADLPDVICQECKYGFVESIVAANAPPQAMPSRTPDRIDEPSFSNQFLEVLRLIAQAAREEDTPPPPPSEHVDPPDDDYLDGWDNDDDDEGNEGLDGWDNDDDDEGNEGKVRNEGEDEEEEENRQDRTPEWAEILRQLGDPSIELRFQVHEVDDYVGNPEDYVDAAGYEALLQNLADGDNGGRRGAPPAAKSAVMALQTMEITPGNGSLVCVICKDSVNVGEMAKKLPCGHGYHGDCIVRWLGSRNSCPLCRFELETDDPEYEEERKKRATAKLGSGPSSSAG